MGLKNKFKDMSPFDIGEKPHKQSPVLLPLIWGASFLMTRRFHLKIKKIGMKKIKPPFLLLSTHQGFSDYYIAPLAMFPHRAVYVSDMEGFAAFGKRLYQDIGCIGKRRYVSDIRVLINIRRAISMGQSVVLFPESRHSNIGINADIPENIGKLCKYLDIPVVTLSVCGSYLANPFWNEEKTRTVPIRAVMECVYTKDSLRSSDTSDIQKTIVNKLTYNEYDYQHKSGIIINDKDLAEGIEKALFCCESCGKKYGMKSFGTHLSCRYF